MSISLCRSLVCPSRPSSVPPLYQPSTTVLFAGYEPKYDDIRPCREYHVERLQILLAQVELELITLA